MSGPSRPALPPRMTRSAWALVIMLAVSLLYSVAMARLHKTRELYGPPFFANGMEWLDFRVDQPQSLHFRKPAYWDDYGYPFTYPAPAAVLFGVLYMLPHPMKTYLVLLLVGLAAWAAWMVRGFALRGVAITTAIVFVAAVLLTSWPIIYLLDTANIEGIVGVVLAVAVLAVLRGWFWIGAALIGLAASIKLYPVILLALLLSTQRYKEFAFGLVVVALLTWSSLSIVGPSISAAQAHINGGMILLRDVFILPHTAIALNFSHALFNPIKFGVVLADRLLHPGLGAARLLHENGLAARTLQVYLVGTAVLDLALYFTYIRRSPMLKQVIALTICAVTLTPYSSDYTLVHLLVPFGLLSFYAVDNWRPRGTVPDSVEKCFVCLCLIFGWETFFMIKFPFASSVRTLALMVPLITVIPFPFEWPLLDRRREVQA